ncbi:membrane protein [Sinomonas atrocyanea]|uniref:Membrane protein n=1 Tax=Sinomonas atrocyanea TaxID=37927 RepID=A0A127A5W8_9MICC|nr:MFS transporter [Sinomonas atrocyanea]AMM34713.1 membrane protein [Sinomonas atrocyanea]GEB64070.1 MFS transporter [Sinomonas atrocyanea]GGG67754.1 MFS transporter [Sinomonas atrocyanea]
MSTRTDSAGTVRGAAIAIFVIFGTNGFIFASWAARIPSVTQTLGLSTGEMGAVLLVGALGSLVSLPLTGSIVDRIGLKATIRFGGSLAITAAAVIAVGLLAHSVWVVTAGMVLFGSGIAFWDVAQNIGGADVEHRLGRTVMPQFHAAFSGGAVLGALLGAALSAARIDLALHLFAIVVVVAVIIVLVPRYFLAHDADESPHEGAAPPEGAAPKGSVLDAWRHPRTVLIGVVVLGATLTEGAGNDWISKGVVDGLGASEAAGAALFAVFVGAMTVARWFGGRIIDRIGRVAALRLSMLSALIGLTTYALASTYLLSAVGAVFWGLGAALAFPMGMSAAADDPRRAAARVSVVSTIGYIAFLAGPPFLGFLGDHLGLRHALLAILVPILVALALAGVTRKEGPAHGAAQ